MSTPLFDADARPAGPVDVTPDPEGCRGPGTADDEPGSTPGQPHQSDRCGGCGGCGGPYLFDTSVPSALWNRVVRSKGGSEYLCPACIVRRFAEARVDFTAELWGNGLDGVTMAVTFKEAE